MVDPKTFFEVLQKCKVEFFTGVPDSLLKDFCAYVSDHVPGQNHIIAANEGGALALAAGYHLATSSAALVYMQNSGFGNSINPLLSLLDREVYSIPALLLIGWRGEPGKKDEPQHVKQGSKTLELLEALEIPHNILDSSVTDVERFVDSAIDTMWRRGCPYAIVVRKGTFSQYSLLKKAASKYPATREEVLKILLDHVDPKAVVVSTTGKTSREIFELREQSGREHRQDFLTVGSMGHASQIALGLALAKPERLVYCLDGDGSLIMHMGAMAIIGSLSPKNFVHVVLNNGVHDSVGGQPTVGFTTDFQGIARACGYRSIQFASSLEDIETRITNLAGSAGPHLLEIRIAGGARKNLGRPTTTPIENKRALMEFLAS